jgi:large subunit ribosomal protein L6
MIPVIEKISVPEKVSVLVKNNVVTFSCLGTETQVKIPYPFEVSLSDERKFIFITTSSLESSKKRIARKLTPMYCTLKSKVLAAISGAFSGFTKELEIVGVGYKAELITERELLLKLGFSHDVRVSIPENIEVVCPKETHIILKSSCNESLSSFVAFLRNSKTLDVYKNKGVLVKGEFLEKKKFKKK